jgi:hypothetical protein
MGTNYYLHKKCLCGEATIGEPIHLGKSSAGWAFSFRGYTYPTIYDTLPGPVKAVESIEQWEDLVRLPGYTIMDEYGNDSYQDKEEFIRWAKSKPGLQHGIEIRKDPNWKYFKVEMIAGYSFTFDDFS